MSRWGKVDARMKDHPKMLALEAMGERAFEGARSLWLAAFNHVTGQRSDGFVPELMLRKLSPFGKHEKHAASLVSVGLWDKVDGGYVFHDYLDHNQSSEDAVDDLRKKNERQARWRKSKRETVDAECRPSTGEDVDATVRRDVDAEDKIRGEEKREEKIKTRVRAEPEKKSPTGDSEKITEAIVAGTYAEAFNAKRPEAAPFMRATLFAREFDAIAKSCKTRRDVEIGVRNFFATADPRVTSQDYPPSFLARDWSKWRHPPGAAQAQAKPEDFANDQDPSKWVFDVNDRPPAAHRTKHLWWQEQNNLKILREAG